MNVLLSIKPEFSCKIFDGSKKFEFRKRIFKQSNVKKVIVYETAPTYKVVGEFEIDEIVLDTIDNLWEKTKHAAGISNLFYRQYFMKSEYGYAIKIKSVKKYDNPISLMEKYNVIAPQSFVYVED